ncbi:MAG: general secretion pathway protein GspK [Deltaproteobacteria bacterium]|nr:general secretion pathway protein GspK [Deltaproteobacteria bacterium]
MRWRGTAGHGRSQRSRGVALLVVLLSLALLSAVVADFVYNQHVKYMVAARERDALRAHYLARSGIDLARLLLFFQDQLQPALDMAQQAGLLPFGEFVVWKLIPLDSEMLCGVTQGQVGEALGFDMESAREAMADRRGRAQEASEASSQPIDVDERTWSLFEDKAAFCDMGGSFKVEIVDEDSKISLRRWEAQFGPDAGAKRDQLLALFLPARYDFLFEEEDSSGQRTDRFEAIAALRDWIDRDQNMVDAKAPNERFGRDEGGPEDVNYDTLDTPYQTKNAFFDSLQELHLVRGFDDEMYDTFASALTIYSEGKVNIKSATNPTVLIGLFHACAANPMEPLLNDGMWLMQTLQRWQEYRQLGVLGGYGAVNAQGFIAFLQSQGLAVDTTRCQNMVGEQSMVFTVKAMARVGDVERTITTVVRVFRASEEMYYWRED